MSLFQFTSMLVNSWQLWIFFPKIKIKPKMIIQFIICHNSPQSICLHTCTSPRSKTIKQPPMKSTFPILTENFIITMKHTTTQHFLKPKFDTHTHTHTDAPPPKKKQQQQQQQQTNNKQKQNKQQKTHMVKQKSLSTAKHVSNQASWLQGKTTGLQLVCDMFLTLKGRKQTDIS